MSVEIERLLKDNPLLKRGSDPIFDYTRIPFNIDKLDRLIGGGVPRKRLTIFTGPTGTGKSYLASQSVVSVQRSDGLAGWIDVELSWDAEWMEHCGVDVDKVLVAQPTTGEEAFGIIKELMQNGIDLVVLDSIAGLVPSSVQDEDFSYNPMAWQARFINSAIPKLFPSLKFGSALIAINQMRSTLGPVALDNMPGGMAQSYFAHLLLAIRRKGWIEEGKEKIGFDMEIRSRKSKVGGATYESCIVPFRMEGGIDIVETVVRDAIDKKIIERRGAWYSWGEEKIMGMNSLTKYFKDSEEAFGRLKEFVEG